MCVFSFFSIFVSRESPVFCLIQINNHVTTTSNPSGTSRIGLIRERFLREAKPDVMENKKKLQELGCLFKVNVNVVATNGLYITSSKPKQRDETYF